MSDVADLIKRLRDWEDDEMYGYNPSDLIVEAADAIAALRAALAEAREALEEVRKRDKQIGDHWEGPRTDGPLGTIARAALARIDAVMGEGGDAS